MMACRTLRQDSKVHDGTRVAHNTYPNDPIEVLKLISHITYGSGFECFLNEKGKEAFFPATTKDDDAAGQTNTE